MQDLRNHPDCEWLQERFDLALQDLLTQFNSIAAEEETSFHWSDYFNKSSQSIFINLLKIAIARNDDAVCRNVIRTAKKSLVAGLSSEYQSKDALSPLKDAIDHFGWAVLSASYIPLLTALSGSVALQTAIVLAENNVDINMRAQLMDISVSAVCREEKSWGWQCGFKETILPLAINLCETGWHVPNKSKDLFLATCLKKGAERASFLSVFIQKLIADTQMENKQWLLKPLIAARLKHLEDELMSEPTEFTWSMPNARARKGSIADFLRGESQETQITGYDGIAMARKDVVNVEPKWILPAFYMESNADFLQPSKNHAFSASMQAKGRGKNAYVEIKKDKRYYELCLKLRELRKQEFKNLEKIMGAFQK